MGVFKNFVIQAQNEIGGLLWGLPGERKTAILNAYAGVLIKLALADQTIADLRQELEAFQVPGKPQPLQSPAADQSQPSPLSHPLPES